MATHNVVIRPIAALTLAKGRRPRAAALRWPRAYGSAVRIEITAIRCFPRVITDGPEAFIDRRPEACTRTSREAVPARNESCAKGEALIATDSRGEATRPMLVNAESTRRPHDGC